MTPIEQAIEAQRVIFEADAEPMGFDLTRRENICVEPWSDYADSDTGHRWGGWLGAALRSMPAKPVQLTHLPYCYIYEWDGPFGVHQSTSSARYNGMAPARTVPVYATPHTAPVNTELLLGWTRYEKLRRLRPVEFAELHRRNIAGEFFDDLVDALPTVSTPRPAAALAGDTGTGEAAE